MEKVKHFADLVRMSHIHFSMLTLQIRSKNQEHSVRFIFIDIILVFLLSTVQLLCKVGTTASHCRSVESVAILTLM